MRVAIFVLLGVCLASGQSDWPSFGRDPGALRFSPLRQIDTGNVRTLGRAWTFRSGKPGSETTPIVVDGVMYLTQPNGVFALQPETGKVIWKCELPTAALRGLAFWRGDGRVRSRVFAGSGRYLVGIDAATGKLAPGFGNEGRVDLKAGVLDGLPDGALSLQSPPAVWRDVVITGSSNGEGSPSTGAYGDIRGWDARSGKLLWTFHTVPRPGEAGAGTWPEGAWKNRSGTNVWGFFTVDVERGLVFAPTGSPTADFYGADRLGDNLYGNSLLALEAATGRLRWHRQLVHHDLWDYDLAAPPALIEIRRGGKRIPAVAQITKMGLLFVFDRTNGEPVYGVEERPVASSSVPGERASPTQPFPLLPPPLARNTFRKEDLYGSTPDHAAFCADLFERNRLTIVEPYTPLPLHRNVLLFPSTLGGGNWGGVSVHPTLGLLFVNVMNVGQFGHMEERARPKPGEPPYVRTSSYGAYARFWNRETRVPCSKPPFGEMVAVRLATGEVAWRIPLGSVPALEAQGVKDTGALNLGGSIATAGGLVFIAATNDSRFRAFDARSGRLLWEHELEANGHASPITYLGKDGKQYVAIMAGGGGGFFGGAVSDTLVAFALGAKASAAPAPARAWGPPAPALADPAGRELLTRTCGQGCHKLEVVVGRRFTRQEWERTVDAMIARGARASDADFNRVIDYLTNRYGR